MLIIKKKPSKLESFQKRFFFNIDELPYLFFANIVWDFLCRGPGQLSKRLIRLDFEVW